MRRCLPIFLGLVLFVSACAPAPSGSSVSPSVTEADRASDPSPTTEDPGTTAPAITGTTGESAETTTTSDRPVAPDFTLALGEGGSYTLSAGGKPVYLVFWAEW